MVHFLYSLVEEITLIESMSFTEETEWLRKMYKYKIKKYDPNMLADIQSDNKSVSINTRFTLLH